MRLTFTPALRKLWCGLLCSGWMGLALAQSEQPQPKVHHEMHSARINQIRATPDGTRVLSVSEDKTVRVWRLRDLAPLRTLRVPSESGHEGSIRALAITPDSRAVIVGGWTGLAWSGAARLYRFELATGRMAPLPLSLPSVIESLGISRDGRWLAVGLAQGGLRVVDLANSREAPERADIEYAGAVRFTEFGPDGTLATTSTDGCLRLYAPDGRRAFRDQFYASGAPTPGTVCTGSLMGGVRFSPDGRYIAWGENERPEVVLMRLADRALQVIGSTDPLQRSLCCPIFTADGRALLYHGLYQGSGHTPLYLYELGSATESARRLDVGRQRFTNLLPLPDGDIVFSTNAPSLVRMAADGQIRALREPPNVDLQFAWERWRLSGDGAVVGLPRSGPAQVDEEWVFSPLGPASRAWRAATGDGPSSGTPALHSPLRAGSRLSFEGDLDELSYLRPRSVSGRALALKPRQAVRSWAGHAELPVVALGTQWSVLVVGSDARIRWEQELPAPASHVSITRDGRWVVAAVGDGSIRWYAVDTGEEALAGFVHRSEPEWVAWRPDGYYVSSAQGDRFFGWLINRGAGREPDFVSAVQLERQLYRPDLIPDSLTAGRGRSASGSEAAALHRVLADAAVPRVAIESIVPTAGGRLQLAVQLEAGRRPIRELGVFVDGLPALTAAQRRELLKGQGGNARVVLEIPKLSPGARVRVEAETDASIGVDETLPEADLPAAASRQGRMHIVSIGIGDFSAFPAPMRRRFALPGATPDAHLLADAFAALGQRHHAGVTLSLISDTAAASGTRRTILETLNKLHQLVRPEDTTVIFFATHGITDAGEFYLVASDSTIEHAEAVQRARKAGQRLAPNAVPTLISGTEIADVLRRIPGRRLLILDTCHAGAAGTDSDPQVLIKRSASSQLAVLSSASGDEESWELLERKHGVFSWYLHESLRGGLGNLEQGTLQEIFSVVAPRVTETVRLMRENTRDRNIRARMRQTPVLSAIPSLQSTVLVPVVR